MVTIAVCQFVKMCQYCVRRGVFEKKDVTIGGHVTACHDCRGQTFNTESVIERIAFDGTAISLHRSMEIILLESRLCLGDVIKTIVTTGCLSQGSTDC